MKFPTLDVSVNKFLQQGTVIPAHPLALNKHLQLDEERQRRLTRYYISCGVGGLAVGVHTTQFEIRNPEINLFETVLKLAVEEIGKAQLNRPFIKVAGICGPTEQAIKEAGLARKYGYDLGLKDGLAHLLDAIVEAAPGIPWIAPSWVASPGSAGAISAPPDGTKPSFS